MRAKYIVPALTQYSLILSRVNFLTSHHRQRKFVPSTNTPHFSPLESHQMHFRQRQLNGLAPFESWRLDAKIGADAQLCWKPFPNLTQGTVCTLYSSFGLSHNFCVLQNLKDKIMLKNTIMLSV